MKRVLLTQSLRPVVWLVVLLFFLSGAQRIALAQDQTGEEVGAAADGKNTFEFVGQIDQNALDVTAYGYLTHISGLPVASLFTTQGFLTWTEGSARFTFTVAAKLNTRYVLQNIIDTDSTGVMTIYYNEHPQAKFADPKSFGTGKPIASTNIRIQQILNVESPNTGVVSGVGELSQQKSDPFTLDGKTYHFGHTGLLGRLTTFGSGKRSEPTAPKAQFLVAGHAIATGNQQ